MKIFNVVISYWSEARMTDEILYKYNDPYTQSVHPELYDMAIEAVEYMAEKAVEVLPDDDLPPNIYYLKEEDMTFLLLKCQDVIHFVDKELENLTFS